MCGGVAYKTALVFPDGLTTLSPFFPRCCYIIYGHYYRHHRVILYLRS